MKPMDKTQALDYLKKAKSWELLGENPMKIQRKFVFSNFKEALDFVNRVGGLAESEKHHPDIFINDYKKVDVTLSTHAIGGLSANDFIMAAKINKVLSG